MPFGQKPIFGVVFVGVFGTDHLQLTPMPSIMKAAVR